MFTGFTDKDLKTVPKFNIENFYIAKSSKSL
jgi:hypothetical protein